MRAFLNGRVDLTQAEAVMDIIRAKTDKAMNIAVKQLDGSLADLINNTRQEILNTLLGSVLESVLTILGAYYFGVNGAILGFGMGFILIFRPVCSMIIKMSKRTLARKF